LTFTRPTTAYKSTDLFIPYNEIEKYQDKFPKIKIPLSICIAKAAYGNAAAKSLYKLGYRNLINLEEEQMLGESRI